MYENKQSTAPAKQQQNLVKRVNRYSNAHSNIISLWLKIIIVIVSMLETKCDVTVYVSPDTSVIQSTTNYTILLLVSIVGLVPKDSIIQIDFPSSYQSISTATNYACQSTSWVIPLSQTLKCSIQYRKLTITNGFPTSYSFDTVNQILQFTIESIKNPNYAQSVDPFYGRFKSIPDSYTYQFSLYSPNTQITSGSINSGYSLNPDMVNTESALTVTITPQHTIPINATLSITLNSYWDKNVRNLSKIMALGVSCNNIPSSSFNNINCSFYDTGSYLQLDVQNVFESNTSPYSLIISPILSPSSTQPQGNFDLKIYYTVNGQKRTIDESFDNKITCNSALSILNPVLSLSTKKVNTMAQLSLKATFNSFISSTKDTFYIGLPKQIGISNLTSILVDVQQATSISTNITGTTQNFIIFKGIGLNSGQTVTIKLKNITNPSYVLTMGALTLYTSRNSYKVDNLYDNANIHYSTQSGSLTVSLATTNQMVGVQNVEYQFTIVSETPMYTSTILQIQFYDSVQIENQTIGCKSVCTVTKSANTAILTSAIKNNNVTSATITVTGVKNIYDLGLTSSMTFGTYTNISGSIYLVDKTSIGILMNMVTRQLSSTYVTITSTSNKVYDITNLTITINNKNPIPQFSTLQIIVPAQLTLPSTPTCSPGCVLGASNVLQISLPTDPATSLPQIYLYYLRNPSSLAPTSTFQIYILNKKKQEISKVISGVTYAATQATECSLTLTRSSTTNSATSVQYTFTLRISFNVGSETAIILGLPIKCNNCAVHSTTSSIYYYIFPNQIVNDQSGNYAIIVTINGLTNFPTMAPQFYSAAIYTNNQIYQIAYKDTQISNTLPSTMSLTSKTFSSKILNTTTSFTIVGISTPTVIQYLIIEFGSDFTISSTTCNSDYTCLVTDNKIKATPVSNKGPGTLPTLILQNLRTPTLTPSQGIKIKSYTSSDYQISQSAEFTWVTDCTPPCKTCQLSPFSGTTCLSCYNDLLLLQIESKILLLNNQCVSLCGDKYYNNQTTSICQQCSTSCYNCVNFSICSSCNTGQYLLQLNHTCYQVCPEGYFQYNLTSTTRICQQCTPALNCKSCSNAITCSSCPTGYYYYLTQCLLVCPSSITVQNSYTNTCDICSANCTSCQLRKMSSYCLTCQNGFFLDNGGCYSACRTPNTVPNGDICEPCSVQCATCSGSVSYCLACNTSSTYKYFFGNGCLQKCPNGYYPYEEFFTCLKCTAPCQYCVNSSISSCISCLENYTLFGSTCRSDCPSGYYKNGSSQCTVCINNCQTCQTDTLCMTCISNYYLKGDLGECLSSCGDGYIPLYGQCVSCSSNCKTCTSVNFCSSCPTNAYLLNGTCMNPCTIGYYKNLTALTCMKCLYSCSACQNQTYCTDCQSGYELTVNFTCQSTCSTGYVPINGVCTLCNSNCTACFQTVIKCSQCITDYYLVQSTYACYSSCPIVYYIYQQNKTCLTACPNKFFGSSNSVTQVKTCISCPSLCSICTSSTKCSTCDAGAVMESSQQKCYATCPSTAPYNISNYCKTCNIDSCFVCSGESCSQCQSSFFLIGGQSCISSCGDSQAYNSQLKKCESNASSSTISNTTSNSITDINFLPMPYLILGIVIVIIILAIHCAYRIGIVGGLLGLIAGLLFLAIFTSMIVGLAQQDTSLKTIGFLLIIALLVNIVVNCIGMFLFCYWKVFPQPIENTSRLPVFIVIFLSSVLSYKLLAFFCINPKWDADQPDQQSQFDCIFIWKQLNFLSKFNLLCKISIFILLGEIAFGGVMCFLPSFSNYLFYGGIQIIILAIAEIILTVMWIGGVRAQGKKQNNPVYQIEQSSEKIQRFDPNDYEVEKRSEQLSFNQSEPLRQQENSNLGLSRGYHSNYTKMKDTIKISNENMKEAFEKGVFRKNQKTLLDERLQNENLTQLQSASKMNRLIQKQQEPINTSIAKNLKKIIPIPIDNDYTPKQKEEQEDPQDVDTNQQPQIIFEALDEEIETHQDQNDHQISVNQQSLGSQQGSNKHLLKSSRSGQQQRKQIVIQDFNMKDDSDEYKNVFDDDYHLEKTKKIKQGTPSLVNISQRNQSFEKKQSRITPIIIDIQDEQQQSKSQKNVFNSKITKRQKPSQNISRLKKQPIINQRQVIHADLQSIGTVEQEQEDNDWIDYDSVQKKDSRFIFDMEQDLQKPSEMLRTKLDYKPKTTTPKPEKKIVRKKKK